MSNINLTECNIIEDINNKIKDLIIPSCLALNFSKNSNCHSYDVIHRNEPIHESLYDRLIELASYQEDINNSNNNVNNYNESDNVDNDNKKSKEKLIKPVHPNLKTEINKKTRKRIKNSFKKTKKIKK